MNKNIKFAFFSLLFFYTAHLVSARKIKTPEQSPAKMTIQPTNLIATAAVAATAKSAIQNKPVTIPPLIASKKAQPSSNSIGSSRNLDSQTTMDLEHFFRVFPDPSLPQNALLPSLDKAVTQIYQDTLHLPLEVLDAIRRLYALIQSQVLDVKLAKQQAAVRALQQKIEVATLKKDPLLGSYQNQFVQAQAAYQTQKKGLDSSIIKLCLESDLWQKYLKSVIAASLSYETVLLSNVHDEEKQIFSFIPTFELSYYTDAFTELRINSEIVRVFLIITEFIRERAIEQSLDWQTLEDQSALYDAIMAFKETPEHTSQTAFVEALTHSASYPIPQNIKIMDNFGSIAPGFQQFFTSQKNSLGTYTLVPNSNLNQMLTVSPTGQIAQTSLGRLLINVNPETSSSAASMSYTEMFHVFFTESPTGSHIPTPLYSILLGFSGIKLLNGALDYLFSTANLESTMAQLATLDPSVFTSFPLIFAYQPSDYIYLDTINFLKSGAASLTTTSGANQGTAQPQTAKIGMSIAAAFCVIATVLTAGVLAPILVSTMIPLVAMATPLLIVGGIVALATEEDAIYNASKTIVKATERLVKDVGYGIGDIAEAVFYYDTGIACLAEGISYSEAQRRACEKLNSSMNALNSGMSQVCNVVSAVGSIAKTSLGTLGKAAGTTIGFILQSDSLGKDVTGAINGVFNSIADVVVSILNVGISGIAASVALTADAIIFIGQSVVQLITAPFIYAAGGTPLAGMSSLGSSFLTNIVSALLKPLKFVMSGLNAVLQGVMQVTAYLAAGIIDLAIGIAGGVASLDAKVNGRNPKEAFENIRNKVNEHRRVIIASVTTAVMLAVGIGMSIVTAGASTVALVVGIGMAFVGAGMMAMAVAGSDLQDSEAASSKASQKEFLAAYSQFVQDNLITTSLTQNLLVQEADSQIDDTLKNQERALLYYQNYVNSMLNASIQSSAYGLGSFYNQKLSPSTSNGIPVADPGHLYGIQTNRLALNPSQGMTVYNMQRNTFAQEVASMPTQVVTDAQNNSVEINSSPTQFWINQKDISTIPSGQPLTAEIRWRALYESQGAFYIGIFMSNQYIDATGLSALYNNVTALQNSRGANVNAQLEQAWENLKLVNLHILNFNNKGKAFVAFRESLNAPAALGFYEHQGAGWINKNVAPINYQTGIWYRMKMQVNKNNALVKCWQDGTQEPAWQGTYPVSMDPQFVYPAPITLNTNLQQSASAPGGVVIANTGLGQHAYDPAKKVWSPYTAPVNKTQQTPLFAGSMGVITSGAAVEYQVITPATSLVVTTSRTQLNTSIDAQFAKQGISPKAIDQEKAFITKNNQPVTPLTFGSFTLTPVSSALINQGIYIYTTSQTGLPNSGTDYVVFASSLTPGSTGVASANNLGMSPTVTPGPQAVVSLVTGNAYDSVKKPLQLCSGVLGLCESSMGLPVSLIQTISAANSAYCASQVTSLTFANIVLTGELGAIQNSGFIYSGPSFTKNLTGKDYFIAASINQASGLVTPTNAYGQKLDRANSSINGIISLVTGQVLTYTLAGKPVASLVGQDLSKLALTPLDKAPIYSTILPNYVGFMSSALYQTIQAQTAAYQAAKEAAVKVVTPPVVAPVVTPPVISKPALPSLASLFGLPSMIAGPAVQNFNNAIDTGGF